LIIAPRRSSLSVFNTTTTLCQSINQPPLQNSPLYTTLTIKANFRRTSHPSHPEEGHASRFYVRPDRKPQVFRYARPRHCELFTSPSASVISPSRPQPYLPRLSELLVLPALMTRIYVFPRACGCTCNTSLYDRWAHLKLTVLQTRSPKRMKLQESPNSLLRITFISVSSVRYHAARRTIRISEETLANTFSLQNAMVAKP